MLKISEITLFSGKRVIQLLLLFFIMQMSMILFVIPIVSSYNSEIPLGGRFYYSLRDISNYLNILDIHGKNVFIISNLYDSVFAIIYTFTFCSIIGFFIKKVDINKKYYLFLSMPVISGICDLFENSIHNFFAYRGVNTAFNEFLAGFCQICTSIKIGSYIMIILTIIVFSILLLIKVIKSRAKGY